MLKFFLILIAFGFLQACSTLPQDQPFDASKQTPAANDITAPPSFEDSTLTLDSPVEQINLEQARLTRFASEDWEGFIRLTTDLWRYYTEYQQVELLNDTYDRLSQLPPANLDTMAKSSDRELQAWAWLIKTRNQEGLDYKRELEDVIKLTDDQVFYPQLTEALLQQINQQLAPPQTIGVFLPLSGRLAVIGKQIRAGILKHHWHKQSQASLLFYDTQQDEILSLYQRALEDGVNRIIGPLLRENIEQLSQVAGDELLALNRIEQATQAFQLSIRPLNEAEQIIRHLEQQCYRHIALINSNLSIDSQLANQLQKHWAARHHFELIHHTYPHNSNNLRNEMNRVLNIHHSQSRAGFLGRVIGNPIEHETRNRQDIEAIILIGDEQRIAVLQPQMDFHQLSLPVIGTSLLTPSQLAQAPANRDLKNIQFPTHPASFTPSNISNALEAFGWDSLHITLELPKLKTGMFIHGSLGQHFITQNRLIDTQLSWAAYQNNGQLTSLNQPASNNFFWQAVAKTDDQLIRQQLLQEIIQFEFNDTDGIFKQ